MGMIALLLFTLIWSFNDLKLNGLTQNKPGFTLSVNLIRVAGFCCGLIGCVIEMVRYFNEGLIDEAIDFIVLLSVMGMIGVVFFIVFKCYHSKYDKLDDNLDLEWAIRFDKGFKVVPLHQAKVVEESEMIFTPSPKEIAAGMSQVRCTCGHLNEAVNPKCRKCGQLLVIAPMPTRKVMASMR